jgi:uncharacterized membrane protein
MTGKFKWLLIVLALSLTANIFVAGMMIGKEFRGHGAKRGGMPGVDFNVRRLEQNLADADRVKVREILHERKTDLRQHFTDMRRSERRIKELLAAAIVDKPALKQALEDHGGLMSDLRQPMQRIVLEVIAELDQPTRIRVLKDLFKHKKRRFMRGDKGFGRPDTAPGGPPPHAEQRPSKEDLPPPPPSSEDDEGGR